MRMTVLLHRLHFRSFTLNRLPVCPAIYASYRLTIIRITAIIRFPALSVRLTDCCVLPLSMSYNRLRLTLCCDPGARLPSCPSPRGMRSLDAPADDFVP